MRTTYSTREVVGILKEEFQHIYPKKEIDTGFISYYRERLKLGTQGVRFFTYSDEDLNKFRIVVEDVKLKNNNGIHVVELLFIDDKQYKDKHAYTLKDLKGLKGLIYFLAKQYNFGEIKELSIGNHWVFDIEKTKKFLKEYVHHTENAGRPKKIVFIEE